MLTHVFLSYVREDDLVVERLKQELTDRGICVWLDRQDIEPGARWKPAIRRAIREGKFFIACFSTNYRTRERTYMNEELNIAIEELRLRPVERIWFIPLKLSPCDIPEYDIGFGDTLHALQSVDLFPDWETGLQRLLTVVSSQVHEGSSDAPSSTATQQLPSRSDRTIQSSSNAAQQLLVEADRLRGGKVNLINHDGEQISSEPDNGTSLTSVKIGDIEVTELNIINRKKS